VVRTTTLLQGGEFFLKEFVLDFLLFDYFVHSFDLRVEVGLDKLRLRLWFLLVTLNSLITLRVRWRGWDVSWWLERR
jgi:hypothetical protein